MVLFLRLGGEEEETTGRDSLSAMSRSGDGAVRAVAETTNLEFWGEVKIGGLYLGIIRVGWI